jgi:hypothetical protein
MMTLYLLQSIIPPFLIGWLAFAPPGSVVGFWAQVLAISIGLVAIGMTGIWAFPPWWTPYVYGVLLVAAALSVLVRLRGQPLWPTGLMGWLPLVIFAALAIYSANVTRIALAATKAPKGRVIDMASPLGPGHYLVANGGGGPSVNAHATLLDQTIARHRPYWGTSHGVDMVALDRWGFRADGILPTDPASYAIFGRAVIAPCAGEVIAAWTACRTCKCRKWIVTISPATTPSCAARARKSCLDTFGITQSALALAKGLTLEM